MNYLFDPSHFGIDVSPDSIDQRSLAAARLAGERGGHSLDAATLVHEAYLRLGAAGFADRSSFFRAAAVAMQRMLVDHARRRIALRRGGARTIALDGDAHALGADPDLVLDVDAALERLAREDPSSAEVARHRLFGGLSLRRRASMAKRTWARPLGARVGDATHIPDAGELIWLPFTQEAGREQAGQRPGLVLSPRAYNAKVGLCLVCPVAQHAKGYVFELALPSGLPVHGVILADHVKSADWQERGSEHIATVPAEVLSEVRAKLKPLLGM